MCALHACRICMPYMYALYECLTCMPYMYALHVCLICMPYMCAAWARPTGPAQRSSSTCQKWAGLVTQSISPTSRPTVTGPGIWRFWTCQLTPYPRRLCTLAPQFVGAAWGPLPTVCACVWGAATVWLLFGPQVCQCICRSLLPYNRSLLPYDRSRSTLTHTSGMPALGLICVLYMYAVYVRLVCTPCMYAFILPQPKPYLNLTKPKPYLNPS